MASRQLENSDLQKIVFSLGLPQKLFGRVSTINEFIQNTDGDITIKAMRLLDISSGTRYPTDIQLRYTAKSNGKLNPLLHRLIPFCNTLAYFEKYSFWEENKQIVDREQVLSFLEIVAEQAKHQMAYFYNREAHIEY